ncbi:unnamed protein product [Urochloa humidicola]
MDSSSPLAVASLSPEMNVAVPDSSPTDSSPPDSVIVPDSSEMELAPDSMEMNVAPDSMEMNVAPDSMEMNVAPDSMEMNVAPDSMEMVPESMEVVPDSLPPGAFLCCRCDLIHEDRQSWNRSHSLRWPCSRCGLIHSDYNFGAMIYGLDKFDCEILIPDVDNVVMDGDTIILPAHVLKMLDEKRERAQDEVKEDAKAEVRCKFHDT